MKPNHKAFQRGASSHLGLHTYLIQDGPGVFWAPARTYRTFLWKSQDIIYPVIARWNEVWWFHILQHINLNVRCIYRVFQADLLKSHLQWEYINLDSCLYYRLCNMQCLRSAHWNINQMLLDDTRMLCYCNKYFVKAGSYFLWMQMQSKIVTPSMYIYATCL